MWYTAAVGFACIISLSAGAEPGRVEVFDRVEVTDSQSSHRGELAEARDRDLLQHRGTGGRVPHVLQALAFSHPRREIECVTEATSPGPAEGSAVKSIVCPPGMTSSRRTVVSPVETAEIAEMVQATPAAPAAVPAAVDTGLHRTRHTLPPLPPLREPTLVAQQVVRSCSAAEPAIASLNSLPAPARSTRQIASDDGIESESTVMDEAPMPGTLAEASRLREDGSELQSPPPAEVLLEDGAEYAAVPEPPQLLTPEMSASATAPTLIVSDLPSSGPNSLLPTSTAEERIAVTESPRFHLGVQETRLLRASENVYRVVPENGHVCDVLVFNPREIALIGKQRGTMQLDFWYDSQGLRRASYLVTVAGSPALQPGIHEDLQKIETLVGHLFPGSRIECYREPDRLIVRGYAVSQRQAIDIVSMVRRSQLIPVVDLVDVRAQQP